MRNVLYILSDTGTAGPLLPPSPSTGHQASVVLIQEAVTLSRVSATQVYVLADDAATHKVTPSFPLISYHDFLRLIFEADNIVAL